jgi:dodecin
MSATYQLLEIVGTSSVSSDDAIRNGIRKVSGPSRQVDWFEVQETRGQVKEGQVAQFQVTLKVGIRLEDAPQRPDPSHR